MLMEVQWFSLSVCVFTGHILMLKMLPVFDNYMYFPENKLNIQIQSSLKYLLKMKFCLKLGKESQWLLNHILTLQINSKLKKYI